MFLKFLLILFGLVLVEPRNVGIINGRDANIADHPWMVGLFRHQGDFFCGGLLISSRWVLSAGHCGEVEPKYIHAGTAQLNDTKALVINITEIHIHPNFTRTNHGNTAINDLSLLRLASAAVGTNIAPIGLPDPNSKLPEGKPVNVTGWGLTPDDAPNTLQAATVLVTPFDECQEAYKKLDHNVSEKEEFCVGTIGVPEGICTGDSGGPAEINGITIGITSWAYGGCSDTGMPGVFVRLTNYIDWIHEVTGI